MTTPQPAPSEIGSYYPVGYYGALGARRFPWMVEVLQNALYRHRVKTVERISEKRRGRVLDVGCGRGWLLQQFRKAGWDVHGTELSEQAARYGREALGLPIETGSLEDVSFPANHFDAITMWHVLEHVPEPAVMLKEVCRVMKPGGVLLVSVPNFGGVEARFFKDKWFHLDVPRHVTHLSSKTLRAALNEAGFLDVHWSGLTPEYDSFSFVQSALNKCGLHHNLLYDLLRGKRAKVINGKATPVWQIAASVILGAVFGVVSLPVTLLAGLFGQGGTTTVLAVKGARAEAGAWEVITETARARWAQG
ncbi:MAG TPA: class I SAM-dependent methyltransferase [Candidatus Dormibacteraeota bacterium]|nr:class I SAM-dependent methyltransferase [Candidatus Dormibacteraeota bacterium]